MRDQPAEGSDQPDHLFGESERARRVFDELSTGNHDGAVGIEEPTEEIEPLLDRCVQVVLRNEFLEAAQPVQAVLLERATSPRPASGVSRAGVLQLPQALLARGQMRNEPPVKVGLGAVGPDADIPKTVVAEQQSQEIRWQEQRPTPRSELDRGDEWDPVVQAVRLSRDAERFADLGKCFDRASRVRPLAFGTGRGEPQVLVAALHGRAVREPHAEHWLRALRKHGEHSLRPAVGADDE